MTNRPKKIGTETESAVVAYLRANGFPTAERRALAGVHDLGDIIGTPGVAWECKGGKAAATASDGQVAAWLTETQTERANSRSDIGVLVLKRTAIGPERAGQWWAVLTVRDVLLLTGVLHGHPAEPRPIRMHLHTAVELLRAAGYGTPLEEEAA